MPLDVNDTRRHVQVLEERIGNVAGQDFPGHYPGEDHQWDWNKFKQNLEVTVNRLTPSTIEFDLVGVDSSIANAIRRILIAEVPTLAIDKVYIWNNTSIMQDEVLAHRLGLVPLKVDPRLVKWKPEQLPGAEDPANDQNTIVFNLTAECSRRPNTSRDETDPNKLYENSSLFSGHLLWDCKGNQREWLNVRPSPEEIAQAKKAKVPARKPKGNDGKWNEEPRVVEEDILLVKMRPGQSVNMLCYAIKGVGKDHAKWSPVSTASYRLLPHIQILHPIPAQLAQKFQSCFAPGVISLEFDPATGEDTKVVVKNPRLDTVSREVLRHEEFKELVRLSRIRDHFIFSIESTGAYEPQDLVPEAIGVMQDKLNDVEASLRAAFPSHAPDWQRRE